ncbi:hypothetical protein WICMUC_003168 [Wickerhamomyces mucosus]|uniref:Uncharacterized protein n=1 Tax=Wickerhamomyces mucosus TaxID=1378264 RepID=A0A9P8PNB7_9ASCO|nr:hypothetical protein WICMUC_003168 [Wickerhamomyces mucosus]
MTGNEPIQVVGSSATEHLEIISEQADHLDTLFPLFQRLIQLIQKFYGLKSLIDSNFELSNHIKTFENVYSELEEFFNENYDKLSIELVELNKTDKSYQDLYLSKLRETQGLDNGSLNKISVNFEKSFDEFLKELELKKLSKNVGNLKPIVIDQDNIINLNELSKSQILDILKVEKIKRSKLNFNNEKILLPKLYSSKKDFESFKEIDSNLQKFIEQDLKSLNKKIQNFNQSHNI